MNNSMASNEKEGAPVNTRREFLVKISAAGALTITPGLFYTKLQRQSQIMNLHQLIKDGGC